MIALSATLNAACGKSGSPTAPNGTTAAATGPNTYLGTLNVAGTADLGGVIQLKASQSSLAMHRSSAEKLLSRLVALVEPSLQAQSVSATGSLITNSGSVVLLTGTFAANVFSMTGGGYAISATVGGGGSVSGTGTAPGGQPVVVNAPTPPPATTPPPADPSGTYTAPFRIDAVQIFKNTFANGNVNTNCTFNVAIAGTLTIDVTNKGSGQVRAHLAASWVETTTPRSCPFQGSTLSLTSGLDFQGAATNLQFGRINSGPGGSNNAGTVTRAETFSGAISGSSIVGTVSRSFNFTTTTTNPGETHVSSYPNTGSSVTLTRK